MVTPPNPTRLPGFLKLSYGVGHVLNDLCASMWFSYMLLYMHKVASFNNVNAGLLVLIGQIADALATPFVGFESDRTRNVRYGRRKIWHLVGVLCVAVSFPFIFHLCVGKCANVEQKYLLIYYTPFIVIFQFGWASTQISHLSLIPELTSCEQGKVELNAIRYFATVMSNLVVFAVCFILFVYNSSGDQENVLNPGDKDKFFILAISVVALGLLFMIVFHVFVKEPATTQPIDSMMEEQSQSLVGKPKFVQKKTKDWFKTKAFYQVGFLYMMTRLIVNVSQVYLAYFVTETLKLHKSAIAIAPAVVYICGILASIVAKRLNSKFGLKWTYFIAAWLVVGSSVYFHFLPGLHEEYRQAVYGAAALLGMGGSTLLINSLAMISQMIGKNTDTSAFVYGAMSLLDKISNGAAVMIIQYLHPCKTDIVCCPSCQRYYTDVMSYVPGVCAILALFMLSTLRKSAFEAKEGQMTANRVKNESPSLEDSYGSVRPVNKPKNRYLEKERGESSNNYGSTEREKINTSRELAYPSSPHQDVRNTRNPYNGITTPDHSGT